MSSQPSAVVDMELRAKDQKSSVLPEQVVSRGINAAQWNTLCRSLFPGANPNSVVMVIDYCKARKLDPMKKPCHIVPMRVKDAKTGEYAWRDVVMPGIYEYRTTAQRTGEYLGHARPEYGPMALTAGVEAPEWCDFTVYRWNPTAEQRSEFPVRVFFREAVTLNRGGEANDRWSKAPIQMLTKCAEAAALREAFPDELGGEMTAEEMDGQRAVDLPSEVVTAKVLPTKPDHYEEWLAELTDTANEGWSVLEAFWQESAQTLRDYLAATSAEQWERLKALAAEPKMEAQ